MLFLIGLLCLFVSCELCPDNEVLDETSDAYQWPSMKKLFLEKIYHEWWFFTFFDEENDIGMAFDFGLHDPANVKTGTAGYTAMLWQDVLTKKVDEPVLLGAEFSIQEFSGNEENATIQSPIGGITVLRPNVYTVAIDDPQHNLTLDLRYEQIVYPARQEEKFEPIGLLAWQSYMPTARVSGKVSYNEKDYQISSGTRGYHDKNWGAWPSSIFNWVWCQYGDPDQGFGMVLGSYKLPVVGDYVGYLFFRIENEKFNIRKELGTLCLNDFTLDILETKEGTGGYDYASKLHINAKEFSGEFEVDLYLNEIVSYQNPGGRGLGLVVFEMISEYTVEVKQNGKTILKSNGHGFNEWSDLKKKG